MAEETAIFGGERRLYQGVWNFLKRDAVVENDPASADFLAEAVQEGHREIVRGLPIGIAGCLEGWLGEGQHHDETGKTVSQAVRRKLGKNAPDALGPEPPQEGVIAFEYPADSCSALPQGRVDKGIDRQEKAANTIALFRRLLLRRIAGFDII